MGKPEVPVNGWSGEKSLEVLDTTKNALPIGFFSSSSLHPVKLCPSIGVWSRFVWD